MLIFNTHIVNVVRFTAPVDVAKDAILVAKETLTTDRPSFELGQCSGCCFIYYLFLLNIIILH